MSIVGARHILNPLDIEVQKAANFSINQLNLDDSIRVSMPQLKGNLILVVVQSATSQIVSGTNYNLTVSVADINQIYNINVNVWCRPWINGYSNLSSPSWQLTNASICCSC